MKREAEVEAVMVPRNSLSHWLTSSCMRGTCCLMQQSKALVRSREEKRALLSEFERWRKRRSQTRKEMKCSPITCLLARSRALIPRKLFSLIYFLYNIYRIIKMKQSKFTQRLKSALQKWKKNQPKKKILNWANEWEKKLNFKSIELQRRLRKPEINKQNKRTRIWLDSKLKPERNERERREAARRSNLKFVKWLKLYLFALARVQISSNQFRSFA